MKKKSNTTQFDLSEKLPIKVKRPKYYCPYCKSYYYTRAEAEACRDRCYNLLLEGKPLPDPNENKLDFSDILNKIEKK